jgi:hypothetical protein
MGGRLTGKVERQPTRDEPAHKLCARQRTVLGQDCADRDERPVAEPVVNPSASRRRRPAAANTGPSSPTIQATFCEAIR